MAKPKMTETDVLDDLKDALNALLAVHRADNESGLIDFFNEPDANHPPEQLARMGYVFSDFGKRLTAAAKTALMPTIDKSGRTLLAGDIEFKYRAAHTQERFNTRMAKEFLPKDDHPDYYIAMGVKESIQIAVYPRQRQAPEPTPQADSPPWDEGEAADGQV